MLEGYTIIFDSVVKITILGTSAVMTNLYLNGKLHLDTEFVHESIIGTQFTGKLVAETKVTPVLLLSLHKIRDVIFVCNAR